ncbi:hypothetical protein GCM10025886_00250 [Tetragenococcus halophilus subsp. flandriensis]|uniref:hypothetical protein n=1 Tax=Tetragenococcus halophilus TaxID=51669 RepID=UPI0023E94E2C|nr:hypothetical protein [Tetragenococcus halophilus]GMA06874.1 hypothetical protein GCM10025886_00250 [Tetragenococcus halophilus subsp. flandriensis]
MRSRSNFLNILIIIGVLVLASLILQILLSLASGVLYLVFKFGIPLLIIGGVIYWLTNKRGKRPRR